MKSHQKEVVSDVLHKIIPYKSIISVFCVVHDKNTSCLRQDITESWNIMHKTDIYSVYCGYFVILLLGLWLFLVIPAL